MNYAPVTASGENAVTTFEDLTIYKARLSHLFLCLVVIRSAHFLLFSLQVRMKGAWFRGINVVFANGKFADNEVRVDL